jgi:hypothetical protein
MFHIRTERRKHTPQTPTFFPPPLKPGNPGPCFLTAFVDINSFEKPHKNTILVIPTMSER